MPDDDLIAKKTLLEIQDEIESTSHEGRRRAAIKEFFDIGHDRSRASEDEILPLIETVLRNSTVYDNHGEYRGQFPSLLKFAGNESIATDGGDAYSAAAVLVRDFMRGCQMLLTPDDPYRHAGITKSAMILEGMAAAVIFRSAPIEVK